MWLTQMHVPVRKLPLSSLLFQPHWPPGCPQTPSTLGVSIFFPVDVLFLAFCMAYIIPIFQCSKRVMFPYHAMYMASSPLCPLPSAYFMVSIVPSTSQHHIFLCVCVYGTSAPNYQGRDTTCVAHCCTPSIRTRNSPYVS
ncbi:hypothetical protein HJG60_011492 [Phyllostomus discolor]|uniref:Uncharacterized protein n=1 Tax=Phyllostomus discolor TaxID=89673 RepID=A0A834E0V2_9CHIR|nr:hypothetical protein HJG60_011492 [Phyllostomus discolor]